MFVFIQVFTLFKDSFFKGKVLMFLIFFCDLRLLACIAIRT